MISKNAADFIQLISAASKDNAGEIEQYIEKSVTIFHLNIDPLKNEIQQISSHISDWIKNNLVNPKLKFAYNYAFLLIQTLGFSPYFNISNFYYNQEEDDKNVKLVPVQQEKEAPSDQLHLLSPYLNSSLFLIALSNLSTLQSSKKLSQESKELLLHLLKLISFFCEEKEIQTFCRRQKYIKVFLHLFGDVMQSTDKIAELEFELSNIIINILAKLTLKNKKNQDYIIQKKGYELVKGILISAQNIDLYRAGCSIIANCCYSTDQRLLFWVSGIVTFQKQRLEKSILSMKNGDKIGKLEVEASLALYQRLCADTKEILDDLYKDSTFMENIQYLITINDNVLLKDEAMLAIFGSAVGIVRKISSQKEYRSKMIDQYLERSLEFLKNNATKKQVGETKIRMSYIFKEIIAMLGVFAIDEENRFKVLKGKFGSEIQQQQQIKQPATGQQSSIIPIILRVSLEYFEDAKLVKTAIGCLTNLSVLDQVREELSKEKDFYVLIYNVIDTFDYSISLLEYCLKMILNNSSNQLCFKNFSAPKFILKLIFLSFIYQQHYIIIALLIKIFRVLSSNDLVLQTIVKCSREYELANKEFRFMLVIVEAMKAVITPCPDIILDIILLLAVLLQIDKEYINEIQEKTQFMQVLKDYVDRNRNDEKIIEKVSQCVAYLPIEDFKNMLFL